VGGADAALARVGLKHRPIVIAGLDPAIRR